MSHLEDRVGDGGSERKSATTSEFEDAASNIVFAQSLPIHSSSIATMEMEFDETAKAALAHRESSLSVSAKLQSAHISTPFSFAKASTVIPPASKKRKEMVDENAMDTGKLYLDLFLVNTFVLLWRA